MTRPIEMSAISSEPYAATWYLRSAYAEDPWISMQNHPTDMLYGENSIGLYAALNNYANYKGVNVFIRQSNKNRIEHRCWRNIGYDPIHFGEWKMVRRVKMGLYFHPPKDHLAVCCVYFFVFVTSVFSMF